MLGGVLVQTCTTFDGELSEACDIDTEVTADEAGRYELPVHHERVWLILNATPRIGSTLIWACGPDGSLGGAQVYGHYEPRSIHLNLGPPETFTLSPVQGFAPQGEHAEPIRQAIRARCL